MSKLLFLAVAGGLGTLARVALASAANTRLGAALPWGTLLVNVLGSLAFGLVFTLSEGAAHAPAVRLYVLAGFLGAFTTFSSLMFDVAVLATSGRLVAALVDLALHNVLGILAFAAGVALGRIA